MAKLSVAFIAATALTTISLGQPALGQSAGEKLGDVHFAISCIEVQPRV